jgi:hypothetical protein
MATFIYLHIICGYFMLQWQSGVVAAKTSLPYEAPSIYYLTFTKSLLTPDLKGGNWKDEVQNGYKPHRPISSQGESLSRRKSC